MTSDGWFQRRRSGHVRPWISRVRAAGCDPRLPTSAAEAPSGRGQRDGASGTGPRGTEPAGRGLRDGASGAVCADGRGWPGQSAASTSGCLQAPSPAQVTGRQRDNARIWKWAGYRRPADGTDQRLSAPDPRQATGSEGSAHRGDSRSLPVVPPGQNTTRPTFGPSRVIRIQNKPRQFSKPACTIAARSAVLVLSVRVSRGERTSSVARPSKDRPYFAPATPGSRKIASCSGISRS